MDLEEVEYRISSLKLLGQKGTTGLKPFVIFEGFRKLKLLKMICEEMGFDGVVPVSGQTYSRKIDAQYFQRSAELLRVLASSQMTLEFLQTLRKLKSLLRKSDWLSAMPYKRNPMRSSV